MRFTAFALTTVCTALAIAPVSGAAQAAPVPGGTLTLADAVALARQNSPTYLNAVNQRRTAAANVRAATGAYLPNLNTSFGSSYREGRQTFFQGQAFGSTNDVLNTDISASANMSLSLATPADRRSAVANAEATEADISAAEQNLRNLVTSQYLTALQAQARAVLQDTLLATTSAQLELARARLQVGSGTQLDVQRAEVAHGQQQVNSLNARNTAQIEKVRLFQQMGIEPVADIRLDATLAATPALVLEDVLEIARRSNPQIDALRYREEAARHNVRAARSSYLPSLNLSASVSGFTNRYMDTDALLASGQAGVANQRASCIRSEEVREALGLPNRLVECESIVFRDVDAQAIRDQQARYPFDFTRNPYGLSVGLSLPIFNGFRREQQVAQATVQRRNAENELRNAELRVAADVHTAYLQYTNAQQLVSLQEQNVRTARLALSLAQERYRVGAISLVELVQARGDYERAETDRITSIYDVQRAFAALEAAAGRPLR